MLHIHNGDSSANTLRESGMSGAMLPLREALSEGPAPQGSSTDGWFSTRARFLSDEYQVDFEKCRKSLVEQHEALSRFREHDEVTIWVGPDLLCQITLIYLLNWFAQQERGRTRLSLVCINQFPGKADFRCLGELSPEQLASLFDHRLEITDREMELAVRAWNAYSAPDPQAIESLLSEDISALPYLHDALQWHLARFPSLRNGLNHIGNRALQFISEGHKAFGSLFLEIGKSAPAYGLGDAQFWTDLRLMGAGAEPLLIIAGVGNSTDAVDGNVFVKATFELTETGTAVLAGTRDHIELNGVDRWLGGVHLTDSSFWRWDEEKHKLIAAALR